LCLGLRFGATSFDGDFVPAPARPSAPSASPAPRIE
jgi:hypothetical protein